ncbi:MAG: aldo/keto reductase, partial [Bryobacteraceae bacterium]
RRDRLVLVMQSYTRIAGLMGWSVERGLRKLRYDFVDSLLLGYWNSPVPPRVVDAAMRLRERGLVRHVGISSHNRPFIASLLGDARFDTFHLRYNALHPGAEVDIFPYVPKENRPGLVAFTATSWKQLLDPKRTPAGERVPTAMDCYRFVMSNPAVDVCMSGPANMAQMGEALDALRLGPMTVEELAWMRRLGGR